MPSDLEFSVRPNEPVVEISCRFAAPAAAVFEAWVSPDHLCRWWGTQTLELADCHVDLRAGGSFRYAVRTANGQSYAVQGQFVEVDPPRRLVTNFRVDRAPGDNVVEVTSFDELPGGTVVHVVSLHGSCGERDAQLADGSMEAGVVVELDRLDGVLARVSGASD